MDRFRLNKILSCWIYLSLATVNVGIYLLNWKLIINTIHQKLNTWKRWQLLKSSYCLYLLLFSLAMFPAVEGAATGTGNGTVISNVDVPDASNANGSPTYASASAGTTRNGATSNAEGMPDGTTTEIGGGTDFLVLTLPNELPIGTNYIIYISGRNSAATSDVWEAPNGTTIPSSQMNSPTGFTQNGQATGAGDVVTAITKTTQIATKFLYFDRGSGDIEIDAVEYCLGPATPSATAFAIHPSCVNGIAQSDGYLQISEVTNADHYHFSIGSTFDNNGGANTYANAMEFTTFPEQTTATLGNPTGLQDYTIRIYNGSDTEFIDVVIRMKEQDCLVGCDCTENIYVNDTGSDLVHKFKADNTTGILSEIGSPWASNINDPHGGVMDLNGYLYIGEKNLGGAETSRLIQFGCDGTRLDTLFAGNFNNNDVTNFVTNGNILYSAGRSNDDVDAYDLCNETHLGTIDYSPGAYNWELFDGSDGEMYTIDRDEDSLRIFLVPYDVSQYGNGVVLSPLLVTDFKKNAIDQYWGMDRDQYGYWYINVRHYDTGSIIGSTIYMLSPTGQVLASINDGANGGINDPGFFNTRGIAYSDKHDRLYLSSAYEACLAIVNIDRTSGSESLTLDASLSIPGGGGKDISVVMECCPINNNIVIDTIFCADAINEILLLQDLINCSGTICEGLWQEGGSNTGLDYDDCNHSVMITSANACGSFTLESDGTGTNPQCGAFKITINIEVITNPTVTLSPDATICLGETVTLVGTLNTSGTPNYQWQSSTISCTTGFTDIASETASSYTATPIDTTYYRLITNTLGSCATGNCADTSACVTVYTTNAPGASVADILKCTTNSETIAVSPSGGTAPYTYTWSGPFIGTPPISQNFTTSIPGTYMVTVTDDNGCTTTANGEMTFQSKVCIPATFTIRRGQGN